MLKLIKLLAPIKPSYTSPLFFSCSNMKTENGSSSPTNNKKSSIFMYLLLGGISSLIAYNTYLVAQHEKETPVEQQSGAIPGVIDLAKVLYDQYSSVAEFLTKPPYQKLLPDVPNSQSHPKTLVLNLSGTLVDLKSTGDKFQIEKRPGLQQFLRKMSKLYEIVIFQDQDYQLLSTIIPEIDPRGQFITQCLGHECMVYVRGRLIKDLAYINRDLKKVIVVDLSSKILPRQKQNLIIIQEFKGNLKDRELLLLGKLLENLASPKIKDVKEKLKDLGDHPLEAYDHIIKQRAQKKPQKIKKNGFDILGIFGRKI